MSDWPALNKARVAVPCITVPPQYCSTEVEGFNGLFRLTIDGALIRCIASDGGGWQHVSVSIEYSAKPPAWAIMCKVRDLFWEDTDWVVQFHPPKAEYVNHHPGCLHLWKYTGGGPFQMPTPHFILVGPKP